MLICDNYDLRISPTDAISVSQIEDRVPFSSFQSDLPLTLQL